MITLNAKKILIPIDFSEISLRAIKHGAYIAKLTQGELILLHVQSKSELLDIMLPAIKITDLSAITQLLKEKLDALAADTRREYGIDVVPIISSGNITSEIANIADTYQVGLIVMGTQGANSSNDLFLGSNAYRVLAQSEIPVMTVRTEVPRIGYSRILLPIDTSYHSRQKVVTALQIADKFSGQVHALGILGPNEEHEFKLKVILPQIEKMAHERNLVCTSQIIKTRRRAEETLACADQINADLIVCMRDETTEFPRNILGTYAHILLNQAKIPVLCIPPEIHPENFEPDSIGGMW